MRLDLDEDGKPIFWKMEDRAIQKAIAARIQEFYWHHNEKMYSHIRQLQKEGINTHRTNRRIPIFEELLGMQSQESLTEDSETEKQTSTRACTSSELGYVRISSDEKMSRKESASKLFLNACGVPSSIFSLGCMPPTSGFVDMITTAAMSYVSSHIPRNSIYAEGPEIQIKLFEKAKDKIKRVNLPEDIEEIVLKQIGIAIGCNNPDKVIKEVEQMYDAGCRSFRIETTSTDPRAFEIARAIRAMYGDEIILTIFAVDYKQAKKFIAPDIQTNRILVGHGQGENCTSLGAGGAPNALEVLYQMYLDPDFNDTAIGLEGGTGQRIGGLLGIVDIISKSRLNGTIEKGRLFVQKKGDPHEPYHGSASAITQLIECEVNPVIAKQRRSLAGRLRSVEGLHNYVEKRRNIDSLVELLHDLRSAAGLALADQGAKSLCELREIIGLNGFNLQIIPQAALAIAEEHKSKK